MSELFSQQSKLNSKEAFISKQLLFQSKLSVLQKSAKPRFLENFPFSSSFLYPFFYSIAKENSSIKVTGVENARYSFQVSRVAVDPSVYKEIFDNVVKTSIRLSGSSHSFTKNRGYVTILYIMLLPFKPGSSQDFFSKKITYCQKSNTNKFIHENFRRRLIYINGRHMVESETSTAAVDPRYLIVEVAD